MSLTCVECTQNITKKTPGIQCAVCGSQVHRRCVGLLSALPAEITDSGIFYKCSKCRSATGSTDGDDDLQSALISLKNEIKKMQSTQSSLIESVQFCSDKVTDFESKLDILTTYVKKTDRLEAETKEIRNTVSSNSEKINAMEQFSRLNNLEIQGIPENENENLQIIFKKICEFLSLDTLSIDFIHRVPLWEKNSNKHKPIIVRLLSRVDRDAILNAYKGKRTPQKSGLEIEGLSNSCYINEHLSQHNKTLFKQTREIAKEKVYKYVWVKNGNIFVRKNETSKITHIKNLDYLEKL